MNVSMNSRLALGTVQFGLPYGIANQAGQVSRDKVVEILGHASAAGMDTLDTAIGYGDCEVVLGEVGVKQWQVVSKLPEIPETCTDVSSWVQEEVTASLKRLRISKLHGLLLHRPEQLLGAQGDAIYRALIASREQGRVEKIGVSVYGLEELDALCSRYQYDLVQTPFNILDRRLVTSGWLVKLRQADTEVHVRSVFLQGLLLMEATKRPEKFSRWQPLWNEWHRWLADQTSTPLQACLSFVMLQPEIDRVVVGVDSVEQLREILASTGTTTAMPPSNLASEDPVLINPSRWSAL
jgi:aryl-alcohol dehydrogenase-like predicted oxidoreductase